MNLLAWSTNGLTYWDLHFFLLLPTLYILATTELDKTEDRIRRDASYGFVSFILCIAVAQAFAWDYLSTEIDGAWRPGRTADAEGDWARSSCESA